MPWTFHGHCTPSSIGEASEHTEVQAVLYQGMGVGRLSKAQSFLLEERTIQVSERSILITWTVGYGINTARMVCRVPSPISDKDNSGETDRWPPGVAANPTGSHARQGIDLALYAVSQCIA